MYLVAQSCLTLWDPHGLHPIRLPLFMRPQAHTPPRQNTQSDLPFSSQWIFPAQRLNPVSIWADSLQVWSLGEITYMSCALLQWWWRHLSAIPCSVWGFPRGFSCKAMKHCRDTGLILGHKDLSQEMWLPIFFRKSTSGRPSVGYKLRWLQVWGLDPSYPELFSLSSLRRDWETDNIEIESCLGKNPSDWVVLKFIFLNYKWGG